MRWIFCLNILDFYPIPCFSTIYLTAIIPRAMPWARSFWAFSPYLNHLRNFNQLQDGNPDALLSLSRCGDGIDDAAEPCPRIQHHAPRLVLTHQ